MSSMHSADGKDTLRLPFDDRTPFLFAITVTHPSPDASSRSFEVEGLQPYTGVKIKRRYHLAECHQNSYLDLFEALARDFGTRVPRNRSH
jgi:arabinan endo-1,5-alpha-L-arabinosidase